MTADQAVVASVGLLQSIDATLKELLALSKTKRAMTPTQPQISPRAAEYLARPVVAGAEDLDSQYGDPVLRFKPRNWTGADHKGQPFSQCPPELLDQVAESMDYFASKSESEGAVTTAGKPKAPYERKDAARARGWAARLRANPAVKSDEVQW